MSRVPFWGGQFPPVYSINRSIEVKECIGVQGEQAIIGQGGACVEAGNVDQFLDKGHVTAFTSLGRLAAGGEPDGAADLGGEVVGFLPAQSIGELRGLFVRELAI